MLQRVVIAMALAVEPALLVLDEPTTALDATVESEVLDLISALRNEFHTSFLFISHNLGVIAKMCDRVGVLYAGELVEEGPAREVFNSPPPSLHTVGSAALHPPARRAQGEPSARHDPGFPALAWSSGPTVASSRTGAVWSRTVAARRRPRSTRKRPGTSRPSLALPLLHERAQTLPRVDPRPSARRSPAERPDHGGVLIRAADVSKTFHMEGETIYGLVRCLPSNCGPARRSGSSASSGSGKTTLARALLGLTAPDKGSEITLDGQALAETAGKRTREQEKALQIVFQNPDSALNRRHSVQRLISRSLSRLGGYHGEALMAWG